MYLRRKEKSAIWGVKSALAAESDSCLLREIDQSVIEIAYPHWIVLRILGFTAMRVCKRGEEVKSDSK